jgi:hypothetical protein
MLKQHARAVLVGRLCRAVVLGSVGRGHDGPTLEGVQWTVMVAGCGFFALHCSTTLSNNGDAGAPSSAIPELHGQVRHMCCPVPCGAPCDATAGCVGRPGNGQQNALDPGLQQVS